MKRQPLDLPCSASAWLRCGESERAAALSEPLEENSLVTMASRYSTQVLGPVPAGYS
jgi:predicted ATP-grasp superfamily ATP-dependent carboligase